MLPRAWIVRHSSPKRAMSEALSSWVVDNAVCVDGYAGADLASGKRLKVLVDIGLHRTGIRPGVSALKLAQRIVASPHLQFMGLQGYAEQLQHVPEFADRRTQSLAALKLLGETRDLLIVNGIACQCRRR